VNLSLEQMEGTIVQIHDRLQVLQSRLGDVMSDPIPTGKQERPTPGSACELTGRLDRATTRLDEAAARLEDILSRLQL
jgi:hypothetical protein